MRLGDVYFEEEVSKKAKKKPANLTVLHNRGLARPRDQVLVRTLVRRDHVRPLWVGAAADPPLDQVALTSLHIL